MYRPFVWATCQSPATSWATCQSPATSFGRLASRPLHPLQARGNALGDCEIFGSRDLYVLVRALHDRDRDAACTFDELRVIRCKEPSLLGAFVRREQQIVIEGLRRLRRPYPFAWYRPQHGSRFARLLDSVLDRHRGNRSPALARLRDDLADERARQEGPRSIVDERDVHRPTDRSQRRKHRILAARSSIHECKRFLFEQRARQL